MVLTVWQPRDSWEEKEEIKRQRNIQRQRWTEAETQER